MLIKFFEKINLLSKLVTQILYSGDVGSGGSGELDEVASLVLQSDDLLLASDTSLQLFSISTDGVASFIGDTDFVYKGIQHDDISCHHCDEYDHDLREIEHLRMKNSLSRHFHHAAGKNGTNQHAQSGHNHNHSKRCYFRTDGGIQKVNCIVTDANN